MRAGGLVGAALLVAAELTTVFSVHRGSGQRLVVAVQGGPHHDWALIPVAALAVVLAVAGSARPGGSRHPRPAAEPPRPDRSADPRPAAARGAGRANYPRAGARRLPRTAAPTLALGALGLVTLAIAVLIDLPDSRSTGLVRAGGDRFVAAATSAGPGLYLETIGGVVLVLAAAAGMLLAGRGPVRGLPAPPDPERSPQLPAGPSAR